jgi:hypothetical protein
MPNMNDRLTTLEQREDQIINLVSGFLPVVGTVAGIVKIVKGLVDQTGVEIKPFEQEIAALDGWVAQSESLDAAYQALKAQRAQTPAAPVPGA